MTAAGTAAFGIPDERAVAVTVSAYHALARWSLVVRAGAVCFRAPYFATIAPRFLTLEPGRCEVRMRDRRRVHNHIGTVHAIALCNLAELSAGVMAEATLPAGMRWIPKGMTVEYLGKATGSMHAVATPDAPQVASDTGHEWPVVVLV